MKKRAKALFLSGWIGLLVGGSARAAWALAQGGEPAPWACVLVATLPGALYFGWLYLANTPRTQAPRLLMALAALGCVGLAASQAWGWEPWAWAAGVGVGGNALYEWWYSRFQARDRSVLSVGATLPPLEFERPDGSTLHTQALAKPKLLIFYRGNWCPLCVAQVREVAALYRELAAKNVEVMLISPQPHDNTASLARRFDAPMTFLIDKDHRAARQLGIFAEGGLPAGLEVLGYDSDTVMPTVVITDAHDKILFADLTDNYRVRPEPETFLKVLADAGL
jgi:peroxiredoxin